MPDKQIEMLRLRTVTERPYFAPEVYALQPVLREGFKSLACDRYFRLYYGEEFFETYPQKQQITILLASIYRLILNHYSRAKAIKADSFCWQIASALEVHATLVMDGFELPKSAITPGQFGFDTQLTVEQYYEKLVELIGKRSERAKLLQDLANMSPEELLELGADGNCADGEEKEWEDPMPGSSDSITPGLCEDDIENLRDALADKIESCGDVPGGLLRWSKRQKGSQVNWKSEFRALARRATETVRGLGEFTYKKLPRRIPDIGCNIAATVAHRLNVVVVIDTSGSMVTTELDHAVAEVGGVLKALPAGTYVDVLACDSIVHNAKRICSEKDIALTGGGGTDMRAGIKSAMAKTPKPDIIIVITDGWTPWPKEQPNAIVIACLTKKPTSNRDVPFWMKYVVVEPDDAGY